MPFLAPALSGTVPVLHGVCINGADVECVYRSYGLDVLHGFNGVFACPRNGEVGGAVVNAHSDRIVGGNAAANFIDDFYVNTAPVLERAAVLISAVVEERHQELI